VSPCRGHPGGRSSPAGVAAGLQQGVRGAGAGDMLRRGAGRRADPEAVPQLQPQHQLPEGLHRPVGLP